MPYLGDFLGHIMAEVTIARMHADLEALRIADFYADNPLLRYMPVPRFRLPDFDVDVPVVIDRMEEAGRGLPPRGGVDGSKIRGVFMTVLAMQIRKHKFRTSLKLRTQIRSAIDEPIRKFVFPMETAVDTSRIANDLANTAVRVIRESSKHKAELKPAELSQFGDDLRDESRREFLRLRTLPPRLHVLVTTREVKEAGRTDNVARLKLRISEEHLEWTLIERDDGPQGRLIPE